MDDTEPSLITDPALVGVRAELGAREPLFHRPEFGTTRGDFDAMITVDYWEVGASGRRYSRGYVLDVLEERHRQPHEDEWVTQDFQCRQLGPSVYLLTYTLWQGQRQTRRSTIWENSTGSWRAIFHQGTVVSEPDQPTKAPAFAAQV